MGDLEQLTFNNLHVVAASAATSQAVPALGSTITVSLKPGLNVVGVVGLPNGFHALMGTELALFGGFTTEMRTRSADLFTAPMFTVNLGGFTIETCF